MWLAEIAFLRVDSSRASCGVLGLLLVLLLALRAHFVVLGLVWGASWSISSKTKIGDLEILEIHYAVCEFLLWRYFRFLPSSHRLWDGNLHPFRLSETLLEDALDALRLLLGVA